GPGRRCSYGVVGGLEGAGRAGPAQPVVGRPVVEDQRRLVPAGAVVVDPDAIGAHVTRGPLRHRLSSSNSSGQTQTGRAGLPSRTGRPPSAGGPIPSTRAARRGASPTG